MRKSVSIIFLLISFAFVTSCTNSKSDNLIGLWKVVPKFSFCEEDYGNQRVPDVISRPAVNHASLEFTKQGKMMAKFKVYRDAMQTQEINEDELYDYSIVDGQLEIKGDRKFNKYQIAFEKDTLVLKLIIDDKLKAEVKEYADFIGSEGLDSEILACMEKKIYRFTQIK